MRLVLTALLCAAVGWAGVGCAGEESDGGVARAFVELGTDRAFVRMEPGWLDSDAGEAIAEVIDDDALRPGPSDTRTAVFVLPGCAETGAAWSIDGAVISAELTGGENTNCDTAVYFLAVFDIPTDAIPDGARFN